MPLSHYTTEKILNHHKESYEKCKTIVANTNLDLSQVNINNIDWVTGVSEKLCTLIDKSEREK